MNAGARAPVSNPSDETFVTAAKRTLDPRTKWQFDIDLVGNCNLACPSCPVGNMADSHVSERFMRPELLEQILRKATSECRVYGVYLYNWTEPFLHPKLAEMVRIVRSFGVPCGVSTNLNLLRDIDDVLAADLSMLKVSLSGFTQDVYGTTHRRGDIETVKRNMTLVSEAKQRVGAKTRLVVAFHRYLGNHEDEHQMRAFAEDLGFEFEPAWAYFMPLEKMLAFAGSDFVDVEINDEDRAIIDRLAIPLDKSVEVMRENYEESCPLRDKQVAITSAGDVMLCCTVFDKTKYKIVPFLDTSLAEIQDIRNAHAMCDACMSNGLHNFFTYNSEKLDALALERVHAHYPDASVAGMRDIQAAKKPRGLAKIKRELKRLVS